MKQRESTLTYVPVFKPASEQTDEDRRLIARAVAVAYGLPLVGDLARPPAPMPSPRRAKKEQEIQPCP